MTQKIGAAAQAAAAPGTTIEAVNPAFGPPSIEGYYDEVFSIPGLLAQMRAATRRRNATGHEGQILKIARRWYSRRRMLSCSSPPWTRC